MIVKYKSKLRIRRWINTVHVKGKTVFDIKKCEHKNQDQSKGPSSPVYYNSKQIEG